MLAPQCILGEPRAHYLHTNVMSSGKVGGMVLNGDLGGSIH